VLFLGGAHGDAPFIDPMGGSGTLAIEHALAARGIAPGLRRGFGFERWPLLSAEARAVWGRLRAEAEATAEEALRQTWPQPIVCADIDETALAAARQNAAAAFVDDAIAFERADVATLTRRWPTATLATNPPYGERLNPADLEATYRAMARAFERLAGWRVIVLCANPALPHAIRRKANVAHRLWNGPLETRLFRYDF
jgi:23S rRNA G2445 N2-methylase RlmL